MKRELAVLDVGPAPKLERVLRRRRSHPQRYDLARIRTETRSGATAAPFFGKETHSTGSAMTRAPARWPVRMNLDSSRNLADWKFANPVIRMNGKFAQFGWAGRPYLLYNRATKKYVIVFEADGRGWQRHKVGFATCDRINGR